MNALSHTAGYAIVALSFVGSTRNRWAQAQEIADQTGIPKPYLSKILHALGKAGVIRTKRGIGGGVALSRPASELSLLEVANAVEPLVTQSRCFLGMAVCADDRPCPMHDYWKRTRDDIRRRLGQTTLANLAEHQAASGFRAAPIEQLVQDFPSARVYRGKPTGRFLRKFGTAK